MNQSQVSTILKEIGLDQQETNIYLALLKTGSNTASKIAEETNINRTVVYSFLTKMIGKGFVSYIIKNNVKFFNAVDPKQLLNLLAEKERNLKEIIPQLEQIKQTIKEEAKVEIYKGVEGGRTVSRDILNSAKEYLVFVDTGFEQEHQLFFNQFTRARIKKKIRAKGLLIEGQKIYRKFYKYTEYRFVSKDYAAPSLSIVWENKVAIVAWSRPPYVVVVEDRDVARSYQNYFELIWKEARKSTASDFI